MAANRVNRFLCSDFRAAQGIDPQRTESATSAAVAASRSDESLLALSCVRRYKGESEKRRVTSIFRKQCHA